MPISKNPKYDLKRKYVRYVEISIILSLAMLIAAFKFMPDLTGKADLKADYQELMTSIDIAVTQHDRPQPKPVAPKIPVEAISDDDIMEDDIIIEEIDDPAPTAPPRRYEEEDEEADDDSEIIFVPVESQPEPVGGIGGIQARIKYPPMAIKAGIQGRVIIIASVTKEGKVVKVEVGRSIGGGCDEEAMRVVAETEFIPGKQRGKPVATKVAIPIMFKLR